MTGLSRRATMTAMAAAGIASVSCSGLVRAADDGAALTVMGWEGYGAGAFHGPYLENHGVSPVFEPMVDEATALAKLRAGYTADVAQPCAYSIGNWVDAGVLKPIETDRLNHWEDLWKPLRRLPRQLNDGHIWFVPVEWGAGSIIYRTDLLTDPDPSWWLLYDDDLAGRITMQRSPDAALGCAALAAGVADPWAMTPDEQVVVQRLVQKQSNLVASYWRDPLEAEDGLRRGDLVASYGWNDMYARLRAAGVPVSFMAPKEGYLTWVCGLSLLASGHQDDALAYDFIDAMIAPETGAAIISTFGYGHANLRAFEDVPASLLDLLALSDPRGMLESSEFIDQAAAVERDLYSRLFLDALDQL